MPTNIGIAFEDVITANTDLFATFMKFVRLEGHHVYVIGEAPKYNLMDSLEYYGLFMEVHWDVVISMFDFLVKMGEPVSFDEVHDRWRSDDLTVWYETKAHICRVHDIALMLEDNKPHLAAFKKVPTRLINLNNKLDYEMFASTAENLQLANPWFDDYEGEIQIGD